MAEIIILLILMIINGLFVMSEIALVSARRTRLESQANKGDAKAKSALDLIDNPEKFLSTAQIGITLIAILTGVYSGEKFTDDLKPYVAKIHLLEPYAATISKGLIIVLVTFLSIIIGELIPKRMGMLRAEKIARAVAGPMNVLSAIAYPIVWLLNKISNLFFKLINIKHRRRGKRNY
jgi:putative hemolysin